jgi:diaminohydroxyphosphoribosylaminopyrimidine deaminase/5-amino-6-(5-phosphoribosylamino)uracil reductase
VVDARGRVSSSARFFSSSVEGDVLVATTGASGQETQASWREAGAEVLILGESPEGVDLLQLLNELGSRGWLQIYCEGGARLATSLLKHKLVDRLDLHYGPKLAGGGGVSIGDLGVANIAETREWKMTEVRKVDGDLLVSLEPAT